jgi:hypothetical protein
MRESSIVDETESKETAPPTLVAGGVPGRQEAQQHDHLRG